MLLPDCVFAFSPLARFDEDRQIAVLVERLAVLHLHQPYGFNAGDGLARVGQFFGTVVLALLKIDERANHVIWHANRGVRKDARPLGRRAMRSAETNLADSRAWSRIDRHRDIERLLPVLNHRLGLDDLGERIGSLP
jgi:hypothetical protein